METTKIAQFKATGSKKTSALSRAQFDHIVATFRARGDLRMELICLVMARCVRIGDVLTKLSISSIFSDSGEIRPTIFFNEQKTKKARSIRTESSPQFREALKSYYPTIQNLGKNAPLFYAEKTKVPLKDKGVRFLLSKFVGQVGIMQCSPHSFRKFGARSLWERGISIEIISEILNHSNVRETRTYLDIKTREVENANLMLEI